MTFIEVKNQWFDAELSQQTNTPDSENLFLHDPGFNITAVEMSGYEPVNRDIFGHVGVEQI